VSVEELRKTPDTVMKEASPARRTVALPSLELLPESSEPEAPPISLGSEDGHSSEKKEFVELQEGKRKSAEGVVSKADSGHLRNSMGDVETKSGGGGGDSSSSNPRRERKTRR